MWKFALPGFIFFFLSALVCLLNAGYISAGLRPQPVKAMQQYLEEDLRIDLTATGNFNTDIVEQCISTGIKKTELTQLFNFLKARTFLIKCCPVTR